MASFDLIVLGGGPAGYVCAIRAAQLGLSTAVVEKDKLGGVCVNIGCIPTKALLHSASSINLISHQAKELGIEVGTVKTDYGVAMKRSRKVAEQNSKGVEFLMKKNKVTVIKGTGVLASATTVKVGDDGKSIQITLPDPQLTKAEIDEGSARIVSRDRGIIDRVEDVFASNPTDDSPVYKAAEKKLESAAAQSDVIEQARTNTEQWLRTFLGAAGFETVQINWAESPS